MPASSSPQAVETAPAPAHPSRLPYTAFLWGAAYFGLSLALIFYGQWVSGIPHAEFGHFPDEPAHVMTALFFRDYMVAHFPSPIDFAGTYYLHYPKIAIGVWPPLFYSLAGVWLLIFGTSHISFLMFIAMMGAILATTLSMFVRSVCGGGLGLCAGWLFVCLRPVRFGTTTMMVDVTLTLLCLVATLCLIHYFKTKRLSAALAFGLAAAAAMLTKGNALELLLLIPLMCVSTGEYRVLLRKDLYLAGLIIAALALPWQILSVRLLSDASLIQSIGITGRISGYLAIIWEQLGPVAVIGFLVFLLARIPRFAAHLDQRLPSVKYEVAGTGCLVVAVCTFHMVAPVPGPDGRYTIGALPPLIFLFTTGMVWAARTLGPARAWIPYATAVLLVAFAMPSGAWIITRHDRLGMDRAADILHDSGRVILVDAEASAEGAFIVSLALLDHRPEHIVIRSSKVMSNNAWTPEEYKPVLQSPEAVRAFLDRIPVDSVLVDLTKTGWEQDRARLLASLQEAPTKWRLVADLPVSASNSHHLQIYSRIQTTPAPMLTDCEVLANIRLAMVRKLPFSFNHGASLGKGH